MAPIINPRALTRFMNLAFSRAKKSSTMEVTTWPHFDWIPTKISIQKNPAVYTSALPPTDTGAVFPYPIVVVIVNQNQALREQGSRNRCTVSAWGVVQSRMGLHVHVQYIHWRLLTSQRCQHCNLRIHQRFQRHSSKPRDWPLPCCWLRSYKLQNTHHEVY